MLTREPAHAVALNNLGALLHAAGRTDDALPLLQRAVEADAAYGEAWNNLGLIAAQRGDNTRAELCFARATALEPGRAGWQNNHANVLLEMFRCREAVEAYDRAIALDPEAADFWSNRGLALRGLREPAAAIASLERALTLAPSHLNALSNLGTLYKEERRFADAHRAFARAVELAPHDAVILGNCASVYEREMNHAMVEHWARRALEADPDYPEAFNLLANVAMERGDYDACEALYQEALARDPENRNTNWNLALLWLLRGDFERGWRQFEWRKRLVSAVLDHHDYGPGEWVGDALDGRAVLLYAEQGVGDVFQFVRYAAWLKERGAGRVIVEAPWPVVPLLAGADGVDEAIARGAALPHYDVHCSLMSLPWLAQTTLDTIPSRVPYLPVEPRPVAASIVAASGLRVGMVWAGNPIHARDVLRSAPIDAMAALARIPGVVAFSLQKGDAPEEALRSLGDSGITDLAPELTDFRDTAAAIHALDVVVTVDTSVAHLAGALGRETWLLLPHVPDFRWMLDRTDSPWYPTMRLFRQPVPGDWATVFAQVADALAARAGQAGDSEVVEDVITLPSVTRTPDGRSRFDVWAPLALLARADVFAEYEAELIGRGAHLALREFLAEIVRPGDHFVEMRPGLGLVSMEVALAPSAPMHMTIVGAPADGDRIRGMTQRRAPAVRVDVTDTLSNDSLDAGSRLIVHAAPDHGAWPDGLRRPDVVVIDNVVPASSPLAQWGVSVGYHLLALGWSQEVTLDPVDDASVAQSVVLLLPHVLRDLTGQPADQAGESHAKVERNTLGIDWELRGDTGWGVYGANLALELLLGGQVCPAVVTANLTTLPPLMVSRLAGRFGGSEDVLLTGDGARRAVSNGMMLRGLGNRLAGNGSESHTPARRNVGVVFLEDTACDGEMRARAQAFDLIVAGSTWNTEVLRSGGIHNVTTLLQGVDPSIFHPAPGRGLFPGRFVIFSGGKLEYRKGQDLVIAAFRRFVTTHPDAVLVTAWHNAWPQLLVDLDLAGHVQGRPDVVNGQLQLTPWLAANGIPAASHVDVGPQPNAFMAQVIREADVALFPNRCEGGTNLVAMECMASGVPTIVSANTGHLDLVAMQGCLPLPTQRGVVPPTHFFRGHDGWGESSVDEMVAALETLYTDSAGRRALGVAGAVAMAPLTWRAQTARLLEILAPLW